MANCQNRKYDHQTQRFGWGTKALMCQKERNDQVQKQHTHATSKNQLYFVVLFVNVDGTVRLVKNYKRSLRKMLGGLYMCESQSTHFQIAHFSKVVVRESTKTYPHLVTTVDFSLYIIVNHGENEKGQRSHSTKEGTQEKGRGKTTAGRRY